MKLGPVLLITKLAIKTHYFHLFSLYSAYFCYNWITYCYQKLTIIIAINRFVIIVNFHNRCDKALMEIFQFCRALQYIIILITSFTSFTVNCSALVRWDTAVENKLSKQSYCITSSKWLFSHFFNLNLVR